MKKRRLALTLTLGIATLAFCLLLGLPETTASAISAPADEAATGARLAPSVTGIDPDTAPNDIDTRIAIGGSGFTATLSGTTVLTAPQVFLGHTQLPGVVWVNTTTMSATVPWGLPSQVYTVTVVNPGGISATLQSAFTVTEGLGEFVTGGPYGGTCTQLALNPDDPATVYAAMFGAGLFSSQDAAGHWEPIHDHDWPIRLDFDAQDADTLYLGADSNDLYRSSDNGTTWERISEDFHTQHGCFTTYPVAHPAETGHVYVGMGSCSDMYLEPGEGGVYFSTNFGDTWAARNDGLDDLDVQSLAVHPNDPQTMLAGTFDGNVYYSQDGADSWTLSTNLTGTVVHLYFNPYETLQAWAIVRADDYGARLYRSTNLTGWTPVDVDGGTLGSFRAQMTFLPGSVWLASIGVYSSIDGGTTWAPLDGPHHSAQAIAIAPGAPDVIYVGTDFGVEKSIDGGDNWQEAYAGLAALVPDALAVSVNDPDTVYVKTHQGIFASSNGGNDWHYLDYGVGGGASGNILAIDHSIDTRLYLRESCQGEFCIDVSADAGSSWHLVTATLPITYAGWSCSSAAITPSPHTPGIVMVGAALTPPGSGDATGVFFASDDSGANWHFIETAPPVARIKEIVYDAFDPDLLYTTTESGLWRSEDGGTTWDALPIADMQPPVTVSAIDVHPDISHKVYIRAASFAAGPNPEPELWVSTNAGDSWQPLAYVFLGVDLLVAPPLPDRLFYSLYTGCEGALCRSLDDGLSWTPVEGIPRPEILKAATDGERSIVYMGTPGGLVDTAGRSSLAPGAEPGRGAVKGSGVYRLTTLLPTERVYLPLLLKGQSP